MKTAISLCLLCLFAVLAAAVIYGVRNTTCGPGFCVWHGANTLSAHNERRAMQLQIRNAN